ncbi:MAG: cobalamin-binding protein [Anaerolineales bacterium]|nr:cobalamin-binding protein [Anaerolineales bacterium]
MQQYIRWCISALLMVALLLPATACTTEALPGTFIDGLGRTVNIEEVPETIISLAPSNTEILYALGLEDKIVGVTEYCDYPEAAQDKPKIGGFSTVDVERVVEIQPDLILAANKHKDDTIPALERLGLTVLALDPKTLDEVLEAITLVGRCTGSEDEASLLVTEMNNRIEAVTDETDNLTPAQRLRVLYVTWHDPLMTVGSGALHNELIQQAGGTNIFQDLTDNYPNISLEAVIEANPQVIITGVGMGTGEDLPFQFASTEPRLEDVDARINNRVYAITNNLVSRSGPRTVDALERLAKMIHPEIFGEIE